MQYTNSAVSINNTLPQDNPPQISSSDNPNSQLVFMTKYSFFDKVPNDPQIYHISCIEITLDDCLYCQHNVYPNNLSVFYYQQPYSRKIYQIICEMVSDNFILNLLN